MLPSQQVFSIEDLLVQIVCDVVLLSPVACTTAAIQNLSIVSVHFRRTMATVSAVSRIFAAMWSDVPAFRAVSLVRFPKWALRPDVLKVVLLGSARWAHDYACIEIRRLAIDLPRYTPPLIAMYTDGMCGFPEYTIPDGPPLFRRTALVVPYQAVWELRGTDAFWRAYGHAVQWHDVEWLLERIFAGFERRELLATVADSIGQAHKNRLKGLVSQYLEVPRDNGGADAYIWHAYTKWICADASP